MFMLLMGAVALIILTCLLERMTLYLVSRNALIDYVSTVKKLREHPEGRPFGGKRWHSYILVSAPIISMVLVGVVLITSLSFAYMNLSI